MFDIVALYALFGTSIPMSKKLISLAPPIFITGVRMTAAGLVLMLFNWIRKTTAAKLQWKYISYYLQIAIIGVYIRYILRYWSLQYVTAIKMGFLVNSTPFIAAIFSYVVFKEKLTIKQWIALIIGVIGYVPIFMATSAAEQALGEFMYISWPELALMVSVVLQCHFMVISRKLIREHKHSATSTNIIRMFGGGVLALFTSFAVESIQLPQPYEFIKWMTLLVLISTVICHNLLIHLLKYYSITFISFTGFLTPLFTALYSRIFLGEAITWHYYVGATLIFIGLYLFYQDELGAPYAKDAAATR